MFKWPQRNIRQTIYLTAGGRSLAPTLIHIDFIQGDRLNMAVFFWLFVNVDLSSVRVHTVQKPSLDKEPEKQTMLNWSPCNMRKLYNLHSQILKLFYSSNFKIGWLKGSVADPDPFRVPGSGSLKSLLTSTKIIRISYQSFSEKRLFFVKKNV